MRRLGAVTAASVMLSGLVLSAGCRVEPLVIAPECEPNQRLALVAQSVPTAAYVPCVAEVPAGWSAGGVEVTSRGTTFWLDSDRAGDRAVEVRLTDGCTSGATPATGPAEGVERFEDTVQAEGRLIVRTRDLFDGGCVTTTYDLPASLSEALLGEVREAVDLYERAQLRREMEERSGIDIGGPAASGGDEAGS